jgi:hypothetical protein
MCQICMSQLCKHYDYSVVISKKGTSMDLKLIDQQSVGKRSLSDTINAKKKIFETPVNGCPSQPFTGVTKIFERKPHF